jgi:hypothetical protein
MKTAAHDWRVVKIRKGMVMACSKVLVVPSACRGWRTSGRIAGLWAKIWTWDLLDAKQDCQLVNSVIQFEVDWAWTDVKLWLLFNIVVLCLCSDGSYVFEDILPGRYRISIDKDEWCWDTSSHTISVSTAESTVPLFKQVGYTVTFISSHETEVIHSGISVRRLHIWSQTNQWMFQSSFWQYFSEVHRKYNWMTIIPTYMKLK